MEMTAVAPTLLGLLPIVLMLAAAALVRVGSPPAAAHWRRFLILSCLALAITGLALALALVQGAGGAAGQPGLLATPLGLMVAVLVQFLGTVIGGFSARYLEGEPGQRRFVACLALVLAAVHLLLLADHWLILIGAWALVGVALERLLCFYPDRAFAQLAAHKKRLADRLADGLLLAAAALAWVEVGNGSLSALWLHIAQQGLSTSLHLSALALVLAVVLRAAQLPVHGWLIQVMESPTPVSALLHAGVVNLAGFVLIRFAPLLEQAVPARALLLMFGLGTAVLAGMVMLTRISIKVRLAWSTAAQMGFMLLECALGLYTLAALHLIGHSLYKAHAFLSASSVVRKSRQQSLLEPARPGLPSLVLAPALAAVCVWLILLLGGLAPWPWWWSAVLALAWAPLLWLAGEPGDLRGRFAQLASGLLMVAVLTGAALLAHALPLGLEDAPHAGLGLVVLVGMAGLYLCQVLLQLRPQALSRWRRWSYAGFYLDESYTRLALHLWPGRWMPVPATPPNPAATGALLGRTRP